MKRVTHLLIGAVLALFLCSVPTITQQFAHFFATRITFGPGTGPQIRWGSATPTGACVPGSLYLQKVSGEDDGMVWMCGPVSGVWRAVGSNRDVYDIRDFGAVCDGATDDTVAIQAAVDAALNYSNRSGTVQWAPTACASGTIVVGAISSPWKTPTDDALNLASVGLSFTEPRAATINYTASSSTITFLAGVITSDDVGNYVFYGPADSEYLALFGETRVLQPLYGCTVTAILSTTSATCVATAYEWEAGAPLTATTGAHASYVTNDHDFAIDDTVFNTTPGQTLDPDHVGKTMRFGLPLVRAYTGFDDAPRVVGSHVLDESLTASPCSQSDPAVENWQCLDDLNVKIRYFDAVITAVTDPTHGKMSIVGLLGGSNSQYLFPDYPTHAGTGGVCGGPDVNCAAIASHQWAHLVPPALQLIGKNPHIDHYVTPDRQSSLNELQNKHTYSHNIYPYALPADTNQRYITIKGASQATSGLNFTGCPADGRFVNECAALIFSKNKYFRVQDLYVNNASGSSINDTTQQGVYIGGLPGVGTQALAFTFDHVAVAGFGVCVQLGDNLGGEMSDSVFNQLAVNNCGIGVRIGPGSYNTLDLTFNEFQCGFNKVAMLNYEGNVLVNWGSCSYDDIDFMSAGFGPLVVQNMRTEGPGIFFLGGGDSNTTLSGNGLAEPQATRQITGDVTATPSDLRTIAGVAVDNNDVGSPANSFFPLTFAPGDFTEADIRKTIVIHDVGASGASCVGQFWTLDTSTTGTVYVQKSACVQTAASVDVDIYDTNNCDLVFPADEITPGDIGAGVSMPDATVPGAWNRPIRVVVTGVSSTTTGTCGFFLGNQGDGPVIAGGGTTTDPYLHVHIAAYLSGAELLLENNSFATGRVFTDQRLVTTGHITAINNNVLSLTGNPVTYSGTGKFWTLNIDQQPDLSTLPVPTSNLSASTGIVLPWTFVDTTNQGFTGSLAVWSMGNFGKVNGGPTPWRLRDGLLVNALNVDERPQSFDSPEELYDSVVNPFIPTRVNRPTGSTSRVTRVKELSESGNAGGNNLRISCTFNTSDTVTCGFERSEAVEYISGGGGTGFDPVTHAYSMNVTSGHFNLADIGKLITFPACCGDTGVLDNYGIITALTSPTRIKTRQTPGVNPGWPNGTTAVTAVVGKNEPDANYLPLLAGCTGLNLAAKEVVEVTSWDATGVVLTSSNNTSTATCRVLVVR